MLSEESSMSVVTTAHPVEAARFIANE